MEVSVCFYDRMCLHASGRVLPRLSRALIVALAAAGLGFGAASAQAKEPVKSQSIWEQDTLTGDWGGARSTLKDKRGIEITLNYIGETFAVLSGGLERRTSYEGRLEFSVDTDLEKLIGWTGARTHGTRF